MKKLKPQYYKVILMVIVVVLLCGCSKRGVHMPKHRKQRHCDCPTFSMQQSNIIEDDIARI